MRFNRREFVASLGLAGLGAAGLTALAAPLAAPARAESVDIARLMAPGPLPEMELGNKDAKVTVVEYASMTCGHCQHFHATTWPAFKEKYVDSGKVRFILREFPLDPLAAGAVMLARCAPPERFFPMIDLFFANQRSWAFVENPRDAIFNLVKQAGFTQESFKACLTNQGLLDGVNEVRAKASKDFGVDSTPTFFVNGEKHPGALSIEELDKILAPLL